jgi:hypothetical protein
VDDVFRRIREQEEALRRLTAEPLRSLRESQEAIAQMQRQLAANIDTGVFAKAASAAASLTAGVNVASADEALGRIALSYRPMSEQIATGVDTGAFAKAAAALDSDSFSRNLSMVADLTKAVSATPPASIADIAGLADQRHEIRDELESMLAVYKPVSGQLRPISEYVDATVSTAATIDWGRIGGLLSTAERERDAVARLTDKLYESAFAQFAFHVCIDDWGSDYPAIPNRLSMSSMAISSSQADALICVATSRALAKYSSLWMTTKNTSEQIATASE